MFLLDGSLVALPNVASEPFLKVCEMDVFKLLLAQGKIPEEVVQNPAHAGTHGHSRVQHGPKRAA